MLREYACTYLEPTGAGTYYLIARDWATAMFNAEELKPANSTLLDVKPTDEWND